LPTEVSLTSSAFHRKGVCNVLDCILSRDRLDVQFAVRVRVAAALETVWQGGLPQERKKRPASTCPWKQAVTLRPVSGTRQFHF
jgi:hypothetical protein